MSLTVKLAMSERVWSCPFVLTWWFYFGARDPQVKDLHHDELICFQVSLEQTCERLVHQDEASHQEGSPQVDIFPQINGRNPPKEGS